MPSRDDFTSWTRRKLAERVGYRCSYPHCPIVTVGPMERVSDGSASVGVAAHIAAAAPGGPRYDSSMTPEERCSLENGVWLCQNHARLIDVDPLSHPAEMLRAWKLSAESRAREYLVGSRVPTGNQLPEFRSHLPWELVVTMSTLHVDLMRLFVVMFGNATNAANGERLGEFRAMADDQIMVLDHQVSGIGTEVSSDLRAESVSIRANLGRTLLALKRPRADPRTAHLLVTNLRDIAARIEVLLGSANPELLERVVATVDESIAMAPRPPASDDWVDTLAARRFRAQNLYLRRASNLGSIADDFGQALGVPYFLIDARLLQSHGV